MVFGVKGPKAILSSAIANALAEFFIVDAKTIESNLLKDAKIVLHNVLLRKQVTRLPMNSAGTPTLITVTGSVQQVAFTWKWAVGSNKDETNLDAWVRDSALTLKGLVFKARLEYGTGDEELTVHSASPQDSVPLDTQEAAEIRKQGGFQAWIGKQVEMIVDALVLNVEVFAFTIEIPPPLKQPTQIEDSKDPGEQTSIVVGGSKVQLVPVGRQQDNTPKTSAATQDPSSAIPPDVIDQLLSLESFYVNIIETMSTENDAISSAKKISRVLEPFSYSAQVTRSGSKRFSGMGTGLTVIGEPKVVAEEKGPIGSGAESDLILHAGTVQIEAFTQLGVMILAPPDVDDHSDMGTAAQDAINENNESNIVNDESHDHESDINVSTPNTRGDESQNETATQDQKSESEMMPNEKKDTVSVFIFPIKSVSLVLEDTAKMTIPALVMTYQADGTKMEITAQGIRLESVSPDGSGEKGATFSAFGIKVELRPKIEVVVNEVEEMFVPDVFRLTKPLENPKISFEGNTLSIALEAIEAEALSKDAEPQGNKAAATASRTSTTIAVGSSSATTKKSVTINSSYDSASDHDSKGQDGNEEETCVRVSVPFPFSMSVNDINVKRTTGGSLAVVKDFYVYMNPEQSTNSTNVAIRLHEFKNELLYLEKVNAFAALPLNQANEVDSFKFAAESGQVSAGYSAKDWQTTFQPVTKQRTRKSARMSQVLKFPFASVSPLKLKISWQGKGVALKDTKVAIKPFTGNASTTSKDLVNYYVSACISRAPGFISNAEVLGINVVDSTASTYGAWLGLGALGAGGGLAAIAAVDSVKGAVAAGKRSRRVDEGDRWKPGDGIRGIIYSAGEATKSGALKRGNEGKKGNVVGGVTDFAVGVGSATGNYVGDNKSKLGAATGAGVGMLVGTMVGGQ